MRADLTKVLTERERSGSGMKHRYVRHSKGQRFEVDEDGEAKMTRQGIKRPYQRGYGTKNFTDVLSPLRGTIRKAVGRKWDDLYSELSQNLDRRSVQGNHVFEHLYDFILVNDSKGARYTGDGIVVQDGELFVRRNAAYYSRNPKRGLVPIEEYLDDRMEFYVDPRDGIIKKRKPVDPRIAKQRAAEEAAEKAKVYRQLTDKLVVAKMGSYAHAGAREKGPIGDVWFAFDLLPVPKTKIVKRPVYEDQVIVRWEDKEEKAIVTDEWSGKSLTYGTPHTAYWSDQARFYHANKRTASHELLKKHKVI